MTPRYGEPARSDRSYRRRPGAYAVLRLGNRVLLTHQARPVPEYQLPGGGIDPGESPLRALHREVFEETGWSITVQRRLGAYRRFTYMPEYDLWAEKVCHIYLARPVLGRADPSEPGHNAIWATLDHAPGLLASSGDRRMLQRHIRTITRSS